jgi:hypothetical protein
VSLTPSAEQACARETLGRVFSPEVVDAIERLGAGRALVERKAVGPEFGWVTLERAGELLGITADAVLKRIKRGVIPGDAVRKWEGRWYVELKALDRLIRSGATGAG